MLLVGRPVDDSDLSYIGAPGGSEIGTKRPQSDLYRQHPQSGIHERELVSALTPLPTRAGVHKPGSSSPVSAPDPEGNTGIPGAASEIVGVKWRPGRWAIDDGVGYDEAVNTLIERITDLGIGEDLAGWIAPRMVSGDTGVGADKAVATGSKVTITVPASTVPNGTTINRYGIFNGSTLLRTNDLPISLVVNQNTDAFQVDVTPVFKYRGE